MKSDNGFAIRYTEVCRARNMTRVDVAEATGLNVNTLVHYESGDGTPTFRSLQAICGVLDVSADYLMGRAPGYNLPEERKGPYSGAATRSWERLAQEGLINTFPFSSGKYRVIEIIDEEYSPIVEELNHQYAVWRKIEQSQTLPEISSFATEQCLCIREALTILRDGVPSTKCKGEKS